MTCPNITCWSAVLIPFIRIYLGGKNGNLLQYFEKAESEDTIPSFDTLLKKAKTLFMRYGHPHAFENALAGLFPDDERTICGGDDWVPLTRESSSLELGKEKAPKSKKGKATSKDVDMEEETIAPFQGDQALAQSCRFMYDATISREVIYATAEGDIGRVWEVVKVRIYGSNKLHVSYSIISR